MHIAQGILKAINVNKLTSSGCTFVFWVADWFALLNNKMGGNLKHIRLVGRYMIEVRHAKVLALLLLLLALIRMVASAQVWKACGMDMERVVFLWSSDEINKHPDQYWSLVIDIARAFNLTRVKRCSQIMGRQAGDDMPAAQILYPCMQCADIFFLKADICQLGLDQRKVNMLARDYCSHIKRKFKPIILSHRTISAHTHVPRERGVPLPLGLGSLSLRAVCTAMMPGLGKGEEKMSKSKPDSAIFMEDDEKTVISKINKSYCPPRQIRANPCIEYLRHIVFPRLNTLTVVRDDASGGNRCRLSLSLSSCRNPVVFCSLTFICAADRTYTSIAEVEEEFERGLLHPGDLKKALAAALNELIRPVREHFQNNPEAKKLLAEVKKLKITR